MGGKWTARDFQDGDDGNEDGEGNGEGNGEGDTGGWTSYPGHSQALGPIQSGILRPSYRESVEDAVREGQRKSGPFQPLDDPFQQLPWLGDYLSYQPDVPSDVGDIGTGELPNLPAAHPQPFADEDGPHTPPPGAPPEVVQRWHTSAAGRAAERWRQRMPTNPSQPARPSIGSGDLAPVGAALSEHPHRLASAGPIDQWGAPGAGSAGGGTGWSGPLSRRLAGMRPPAPRGVPMAPSGPGALHAQWRMQEEETMAALRYATDPYSPAAAPINVTQLVYYSQDLAHHTMQIGIAGQGFSAHYLGLLDLEDRIIHLSPALFPPGTAERLDRSWHLTDYQKRATLMKLIEDGEQAPLARFVLALLWIAWHKYDAALANALNVPVERVWSLPFHPTWQEHVQVASAPQQVFTVRKSLAVALAPMHLPGRALWQDWHARYHSYLWRQVGLLLANHHQLDAQTADYLMTDEVPPLVDDQRREAVYALKVATRDRVAGTGEIARAARTQQVNVAWDRYVAEMAHRSKVPWALAWWRLSDRDQSRIRTEQDSQKLTDLLCFDSPHLGLWRQHVAKRFCCRDERDVVLWLAEPYSHIPPLPKQQQD